MAENEARLLRVLAQRFIELQIEVMTLRAVLSATGAIDDNAFDRALTAAREERKAARERVGKSDLEALSEFLD